MFDYDMEFNKGILFIRLKGDLTRKNCLKINYDLINFINDYKVKYMVYNLYELDNLDIFGIDAILNTKYLINKNKGLMLLCEVPKKVYQLVKRKKLFVVNNELTAINMIGI